MSHRFFIETDRIGKTYIISGENVTHITKSLRMRPGEAVVLCTPTRREVFGEIISVGKTQVEIEVLSIAHNTTEPRVQYHLFQCLPKGDKMDSIIQKATELGVFDITPVLSERCISRPDPKTITKKLERWNRIALEAAKQSQRGLVPRVNPPLGYRDAVVASMRHSEKTILFYEDSRNLIRHSGLPQTASQIGLIIGCEGGFSPDEVAFAKDMGTAILSLGRRILRAETAPTVALALLGYYFDDM